MTITRYRSVDELNQLVAASMERLPRDAALVVGIPRSGMLLASMLSLYLDVPLLSFPELLAGTHAEVGLRGCAKRRGPILIADDSVASGASISAARERLEKAAIAPEAVWVTAYVAPGSEGFVDVAMEAVEMPRVFEWNVMHHRSMNTWAVDIDGVLCRDPTPEQNDDGARYESFLECAEPLWLPNRPVGWLVSCRLEKFRPQTEAWLRRQGIEYQELILLDLPSAEERRKWARHSEFKAQHYRHTGATLFVESSDSEAIGIANAARASCFSVQSRRMMQPGGPLGLPVKASATVRKIVRRAKATRQAYFSAPR